MMNATDTIESAIIAAATKVLSRRADALRHRASTKTASINDKDGQPVLIVDPQARVAIGTAELFEAIAADIEAPVLTALGHAAAVAP